MRSTYYQGLEERQYPTLCLGVISKRLFSLREYGTICNTNFSIIKFFVSKKRLASQLCKTNTPGEAGCHYL